ncbi:hypothetical protein DM806_05440 [Sphingobium lactosutens]|uniref:hypothetical protein n=1 Tax=Sphingobium lactosutens TaxID=522773 RepID=UPI0015C0B2A5|nr:hypothetical protein [Sphingobium lactosutens]NWK95117.1 hypothetical protein [Sphingobium lactosutens]
MTSIDPFSARQNLIHSHAIGNHSADPLPRLLAQLVARAGDPTMIERATSRPWASALFEGRRHVIRLKMGGSDAAARRAQFADGLEEAEWTLPRHFVADICIDDQGKEADSLWIELSALTIRDW